ncbi:MAG TPA: DUF2795 domain-containing protein [Angustibacter sp.]|nr:DUF2795 domain-containing protein [Angustibacter sp.]
MSQQQSGPVGPREDEELKHETRGLEQGGHSTHAEEWREPEPAGEDQPTGDEHVVPEWLEQGTPPGMTPDDVEERSQLARFLDPSVFPADRDALVESAQRNEAPDVVVDRLRQLPADQQFHTTQDVARAAGLGTEERRT